MLSSSLQRKLHAQTTAQQSVQHFSVHIQVNNKSRQAVTISANNRDAPRENK